MKALIIIHIFFKYCFAVQCGSHNNYFCPTNAPCCSKYGYCGTIDHCKPENCVANCPHKTLKNKIKKRRAVSNRQSLRNESISFGELEREQVCNVVSNCRSNNLAALTFDDGIDP